MQTSDSSKIAAGEAEPEEFFQVRLREVVEAKRDAANLDEQMRTVLSQ